ncbi:MAG: ATP-binding domain-containing protein [Actinomycetes bacterium]
MNLLENGWEPLHVALLTTCHRHPVQVEQQRGGQDSYWSTFWTGHDMFYGTVMGFKGLERPAVVLAIDGFHDGIDPDEVLYCGMSRARDLLIVGGSRRPMPPQLRSPRACAGAVACLPRTHRSSTESPGFGPWTRIRAMDQDSGHGTAGRLNPGQASTTWRQARRTSDRSS